MLKIPKNGLKKWIKALRSEKYIQGKNRLQFENRFCCLGVACKEFILNSNLEFDDNAMAGKYPWEQKNAPKWIQNVNTDFYHITGVHLTSLNDGDSFELMYNTFNFDEIADLLELVYIHKALN